MFRRAARSPLVVSWVVGAAVLLATTPATAASSVWSVVPTPNPAEGGRNVTENVQFYGSSSSSASDSWGVGLSQGKKAKEFPLAEHWNGTSWTPTTVPVPTGRQGWLQGVYDLSPTNAWAVGLSEPNNQGNSGLATLIEHWNGTDWSIVTSPNPVEPDESTGSLDQLMAVSGTGPDDIWAVGWDYDARNGYIRAIFVHWNGSEWSASRTPGLTPSLGIANSVTAVSSNDVWAAGEAADGPEDITWHFDGTTWTQIPAPSPDSSESTVDHLEGISSSRSGNIWAAGYEVTNVDAKEIIPYVLHWDGNKWDLTYVPNPNEYGSYLFGVLVISDSDVWIVGHTQGEKRSPTSFFSLTEEFNGISWSVVKSPSPPGPGDTWGDTLFALSSPGSQQVWALGVRTTAGHCCSQTLAVETTRG